MPAIPDGFEHLLLSSQRLLNAFSNKYCTVCEWALFVFIYDKAEFICTYSTFTAAHIDAGLCTQQYLNCLKVHYTGCASQEKDMR